MHEEMQENRRLSTKLNGISIFLIVTCHGPIVPSTIAFVQPCTACSDIDVVSVTSVVPIGFEIVFAKLCGNSIFEDNDISAIAEFGKPISHLCFTHCFWFAVEVESTRVDDENRKYLALIYSVVSHVSKGKILPMV